MRIRFQRTGGFAGTRLELDLDSSTLPPDEARKLEKLLKDARFFDLPEHLRAERSGADRFEYRVTIESAERSHTIQAGEGALPATLRPLLDFLARSARPPARG
jgi:hypothetical protein